MISPLFITFTFSISNIILKKSKCDIFLTKNHFLLLLLPPPTSLFPLFSLSNHKISQLFHKFFCSTSDGRYFMNISTISFPNFSILSNILLETIPSRNFFQYTEHLFRQELVGKIPVLACLLPLHSALSRYLL